MSEQNIQPTTAPAVASSALLGRWIHLAIAGGPNRKLIIAQDDGFEYLAILEFGDLRFRLGKHASTPNHAAMLLENELERKRDMWCYGHGPNDKLSGGGVTEPQQQTERTPRRPLK